MADRLRALGPGSVEPARPTNAYDVPTGFRQWVRRSLVAGGVATAMAAGSAWLIIGGGGSEYVTPIGGFERLPLADGSQVELNTDTKVEVAYSDGRRRIELDRGEAYFNVTKDKNRPFVVDAGPYDVIAVGTAFSVRRNGEDIDVFVTEGRIRVESDEGATARPVLVSAGQKVSIRAGVSAVAATDEAEHRRQLSWREGMIILDNRPLREVAAEFNRYNEQKLVVLDPKVGAVTMGGTFRPGNLPGFIRLLEPGFGIKAVPDGEKRIILTFAE